MKNNYHGFSRDFHFSFHFISHHLASYPCPKDINAYWNCGFLLGFVIYIQILTGILLGLHYTPDIYSAYYSVIHIYREVYFGWYFRFIHSSVASFVFITVFLHLTRGIFYGSYFYISNVIWIGILIIIVLMAIAFMGYVLPWGQMSYWGATVITNLLSGVPCLVPWTCGGFYISNPTISRFFIIHFILPLYVSGFLYIHVFYIHRISSNNSLGYNTNNKIQFYPWLIYKDILVVTTFILIIIIQVSWGITVLSNPDNVFEVSVLFTPLHIVPEWYFLEYYSILKAIPNKYAGFLIMFSFIYVLNIYGEPYNPSSLIKCPGYTGKYFIWFLGFLMVFYFLWIGVQLPQEKYISYGRGYLMVSILGKIYIQEKEQQ